MKEDYCDILVVGAGVAGLCSAIAAARKGLSTILIEKELEIGHKIKGECIRKDARIFNTIFGRGLPESVIVNNISTRRLYGPNPSNYIDGPITVPSVALDYRVIIDYRLFVVKLFEELSKTKCKVFLNTIFLEPIKDVERVFGAICKKDDKELKIKSKYVIAADGNHSRIGQKLKISSQKEIYPSIKFIYENLNLENPERIELYIVLEPPGVMWCFPKGKSSGELGIALWTHDVPDDFDIFYFWERKSMEHPVINKIIEKAKYYYVSKDYLNFGGPIEHIFGEGVVFVGDSGGHVGGVAAPGTISSMTTGFDCTDFIANGIKSEGIITDQMVKNFLDKFEKSPMQKWLKDQQSAGKMLRNILFEQYKTIDRIDENWEKIKRMINQ